MPPFERRPASHVPNPHIGIRKGDGGELDNRRET
jgi:hypothetical protein